MEHTCDVNKTVIKNLILYKKAKNIIFYISFYVYFYVYFRKISFFHSPGIMEFDSARLKPQCEMILIVTSRQVNDSCNLIVRIILFVETYRSSFSLPLFLSFLFMLYIYDTVSLEIHDMMYFSSSFHVLV